MSYVYEHEKPYTATDAGMKKCFDIYIAAQRAVRAAGVVTAERLMHAGGGGDSWQIMACVDRLVELGMLKEVPVERHAWQERLFRVKGVD